MDEFAVEEVEFVLGLLEGLHIARVKRFDDMYRPTEIGNRHFCHIFNLSFELSYCHNGCTEHLFVKEIEMRLILRRLRLVFDNLASQCNKCAC